MRTAQPGAWVRRSGSGATLAALLVLLVAGGVGAAPTGLVAAYGFEEGAGTSAADSSGAGRTATVVGAAWAEGRFGGGLALDGIDDRVDLPGLGTFYRQGFTLEAWVRKRTAKQDVAVLGSWAGGSDGGPMIWVDHLSGRYHLTLNRGFANYLDSGRAPAVGTWQHVAATWDGAVARFYVDGVETASRTFSGDAGATNAWRVGAYGASPTGFFDGTVDEVRVYDRALSAVEVQEDMAAPVVPPDTTPPSAPGTPAPGDRSQTSIAVSWAPSTDDVGVAGYTVLRDGIPVATTAGTTYTFTALTCETEYTLAVEAFDGARNVSPRASVRAATEACDPVPSGLVAGYALDEGGGAAARDESGNGRTGSIVGAAWTQGRFRAALSFSGSGDRVDLPGLGTFYRTGFTYEAWVRKRTAKQDVAVLGSWVGGQGGGPMIWVDHVAGRYRLTLGTGLLNYLDAGRAPAVGAWQHVAATYDGVVARFYLDGQETASRVFTSDPGGSDTWRVGAYGSPPGGFFDGVLDEIRVYDRALSAGEIAADMTRSVGPPDTTPPSQPAHFTTDGRTSTTVATRWEASTDNVGVAGYTLYRNGTPVATTTGTSYAFSALACDTAYQLGVEAFDEEGNASVRTTLSASTAACDTTPPSVALSAPAPGSTVGGTVAVTATALDDDAVEAVTFLLDGAPLGAPDPTAPYSVAWDTRTAAAGLHTLGAVARDLSGNETTSAPVEVTVDNSATPRPGLVAAYAFDEGTGAVARDASGNGRDGAIVGATWTPNGRVGSALSLNTTGDRVDLPALGTFYRQGFTLEAWVRKRSDKPDAAVLGTWVSAQGGGPMVWADHVAGRYRLTLGKGPLGDYLDSGRAPAVGQWQHLASTYDGAVARFYVDGTETASRAFSGDFGTSDVWRVGAYGATPSGFFDGVVDEIRIYDRALSPAELAEDMAKGVGPPDTQPPTSPDGFAATSVTDGSVATAWRASSDNVGVTGYRLRRNGLEAATTAATAFTFDGLDCGTTYDLAVEALDAAGNASAPAELTVSTSACDTTPPTVGLTAPADGATVSASLTVEAGAADDDRVAGVQFRLDGVPLGAEDTSAPFAVLWDTRTAANGTHVLTAVARDRSGNTATSAPVTVTVANTATSAEGLVASFSFDEGSGTTAADDSGNGNAAVLDGARWAVGRHGTALQFDGMDDWATVADADSLDLAEAMTLEAWIMPTALAGSWRTVLFKEQQANVLYSLYAHTTDGGPSASVFVRGAEHGVQGAGGLETGRWTHLAATYDGAELRLYLDGALVASEPTTGALPASDGPLRIGGNGVWPEWFAGRIDDVRVYRRALTAGEIMSDRVTPVAPDTNPPRVTSTAPAAGAADVGVGTPVVVSFGEAIDPATVDGTTIHLDGPGGTVPAAVSYDAVAGSATLSVASALLYGTTYTVTVEGGTSGPRVRDVAGNALSADHVWTFTTEPPPPPVLVVESSARPFSSYAAELLRAEGVPFTTIDLSLVTPGFLEFFDVVVLGAAPVEAVHVQTFSTWVAGGGNLVALRPDKRLAGLLGLADAGGTLADGYLLVDTAAAPGAGIVGETIQFHGVADRYVLDGARSLATLYTTAHTPAPNPAVTLNEVGTAGGEAAAFAYDLAASVVVTRQGNPAWAGQDRDGIFPIRPNDLFFGAAVGDDQLDWVDTTKIGIPQADEQQRLLVNLIAHMSRDRKPIPRFWYLPRGEKAVVVMTGDDHAVGGTAGRFEQHKAQSPAGCSVAEWECIRATSYVYPSSPLTAAQAAGYVADGFEVALHVNTGGGPCSNWTPSLLRREYAEQLAAFAARYPGVPAPVTERTHCVAWSDWATQPQVELEHGIRLDTNYYHYPSSWIGSRPGFMTGSGIPMRFADRDGRTIDVYQAHTHMTDEAGQAYPATIDALLDGALGPSGFYGVFTANMHTDEAQSPGADAIVAAARARSVPVISARQLLTWLDGRAASSFRSLAWEDGALRFTIRRGAGANGLEAMLPAASAAGAIAGITHDGAPVAFELRTVKGVGYAVFPAAAGAYRAVYGS